MESNALKSDISFSDSMLVFRNKLAYFETLEFLKSKSSEEKIKWAKSFGLDPFRLESLEMNDSIQNQTAQYMRAIGDVYNRNCEVQIGDSIIWFHDGVEYLITNGDIRSLRDVQNKVLSGQIVQEHSNLVINFLSIVNVPYAYDSDSLSIVRFNRVDLPGITLGYEYSGSRYQICWYYSLYLGVTDERWESKHKIQVRKTPTFGSAYWSEMNTPLTINGSLDIHIMARDRYGVNARAHNQKTYNNVNSNSHSDWGWGVFDHSINSYRIHYIKFSSGTTPSNSNITVKVINHGGYTYTMPITHELKMDPYKNYIFDHWHF